MLEKPASQHLRKFHKIFRFELARRLSALGDADKITKLKPGTAHARLVSKEQLERFRAGLSAKDRRLFDQYLGGGDNGDLDESETPQFRRFLRRMDYVKNLQGDEESPKPSRKPSRKEEELELLFGDLRQGLSVRKLPKDAKSEDALDVSGVELSGPVEQRLAELLQAGLSEKTIIKIVQYEALPKALQGIDFSARYDLKTGSSYHPILQIEGGRELLEQFDESKIPDVRIRDRVRVLRRRAATFHLRLKSKHNSQESS